jgi:hypothetical protein
MNFVIESEYVHFHFNDVFAFKFSKNLTFVEYIEDLELMTLKLLPFKDFSRFLSCRSESASMKALFPAEPYSLGGFILFELVIPSGITIFPLDSLCMS